MRILCLRTRYQLLLAILVVLVIQLILWIFVVFIKPSNQITIYLDGAAIDQNRLEFQNAILIQDREEIRGKVQINNRARGLSDGKHHKKGGILAKLDAIKEEKRALQDHAANGHDHIQKNETNPVLLEREMLIASRWSGTIRQQLLANLEPSLFTEDIAAGSDSSCSIVEIEAPESLCRHSDWECNHSPTFTTLHRQNRSLTVQCLGDFKVDWYFERNGGLTSDAMKKYTDRYSDWTRATAPINIPFRTQYADVVCRVKTGNGTKIHHNYRTQFIPNKEAVVAQKQVFDELKYQKPDWRPLSILSINVDSVSRAQFHRSCGLPKTRQLLRSLFNASTESSHQAFLFNRLNAIGGVTAMNLTPLYAGIFFKKADEEKRVRIHRYTKPIKEWMWDYANQHGFLTSYAMDSGNGLMGTRTICPIQS